MQNESPWALPAKYVSILPRLSLIPASPQLKLDLKFHSTGSLSLLFFQKLSSFISTPVPRVAREVCFLFRVRRYFCTSPFLLFKSSSQLNNAVMCGAELCLFSLIEFDEMTPDGSMGRLCLSMDICFTFFYKTIILVCSSEPAFSFLFMTFSRSSSTHVISQPYQILIPGSRTSHFNLYSPNRKDAEQSSSFVFPTTYNLPFSKNKINILNLTWIFPADVCLIAYFWRFFLQTNLCNKKLIRSTSNCRPN